MSLTAAQIPILKAALLASNAAGIPAARAAGDHGAIAAYANSQSSTPIYKPLISVSDLNSVIIWSEFIALTVQQQNAYFALTQGGFVNASSVNVRNAFGIIFNAANSPTLTALGAIAVRTATLFESLFTVGGVCSCFGQTVTAADIALALNS